MPRKIDQRDGLTRVMVEYVTKPNKLLNLTKSAKTSTPLFILLCLNYITRYYCNTKREFSLLYKLIFLVSLKATRLLRVHLILNTISSLNILKKSPSAQKLYLTALSSQALKSKQLSDIFLTLICENLHPSYVR
jgi:hypothetical protein